MDLRLTYPKKPPDILLEKTQDITKTDALFLRKFIRGFVKFQAEELTKILKTKGYGDDIMGLMVIQRKGSLRQMYLDVYNIMDDYVFTEAKKYASLM